jgi:hypothetical protein
MFSKDYFTLTIKSNTAQAMVPWLQNWLNLHLQLVAMYAQKNFIPEIFPYVATFESWANVMTANGWGQY